MQKITQILKTQIVLILSFVLAVISVCLVPPNAGYKDYIDFRTLALLFCLMAVMAGWNRLGVFRLLAGKMLSKVGSLRGLGLTLCMLCFFSSMLITNDVALITFVPFTIVALRLSGKERWLPLLAVLETIGANLGSMLTPVGNPQNLYLFSTYNMDISTFIFTILPYAAWALLLLLGSVLFLRREVLAKASMNAAEDKSLRQDLNKPRCLLYGILFLLALLTVFRLIPYSVTLSITLIAVLLLDRATLKHVDYSLLATFVFLFIFIGNLGNIPQINMLLQKIVAGHEVPVGILSSQVFSNVPAAILLSGFTPNGADLLIGVNLGGLGTLIASMASLISFRLVAKEGVRTGKYLLLFTVFNLVFLALEVGLWWLMG